MGIKYDDNGVVKKPGVKIQFDKTMMVNFAQSAKSVEYFASHFYYIINPVTGAQKIKLRPYQQRVLQTFQNKQFNILLSARQVGKTTCSAIYILWYCLFNKDKTVAILANQAATAKSILTEIKYAYERLPNYLKPGILQYNEYNVKFENGCSIIAKATSAHALRGESVSLLYMDEVAFIPQNIAEDFWTANWPTLSTGGSCILVSTPNGTANLFYRLWKASQDKENDFVPSQVDWWEVEGRDEKWKEQQIRSIGKVKFAQEFGNQFQGSAVTLIDAEFLIKKLVKVQPLVSLDEFTRIWEHVEPNKKYLLSIDTGAGVGSDYSVINIFDITNYPARAAIQVGVWRRNDTAPPQFSDIVLDTAKKWNNAYIIGETNGLSNEVISRIFESEYEYIFYDYDDDIYGVCSDVKSKKQACIWFKENLESGKIILKDSDTIDELSYFEEVKEGIYKAKSGRGLHDDCVVTCLWATYFLKSGFFDDERDEWKLQNTIVTKKQTTFSEKELESIAKNEAEYDIEEAYNAFITDDNNENGEKWLSRDELRRNPRRDF